MPSSSLELRAFFFFIVCRVNCVEGAKSLYTLAVSNSRFVPFVNVGWWALLDLIHPIRKNVLGSFRLD